MMLKKSLDFRGLNLETAPVDLFFDAAGQPDETIFINVTGIAGYDTNRRQVRTLSDPDAANIPT